MVRELNRRYRNKDSTTDVLSFPLYGSASEFPPEGEFLLGDIVINPQMAERSAADTGESRYGVVRRLLVHGLLHLMGFDHEKGPRGKKAMEKKETEVLGLLGSKAGR